METEIEEKTRVLMDKELIKVLLVEDDAIDRKLVERALANCSRPVEFVIDPVGSISEAVEHLESKKYNIVLLDLMLPDSHGVETVQRIKETNSHIPIVVLTGLDDEQTGLTAIEKGATDYLVKGQSLDNILVRTILHALARKKETEEWWRTFDAISDLVFIQDKDFTITKANKAFTDAIKSKPEDIIGKKCYEVLHRSDTPWPSCPFERTKKDNKSHNEEVNDPNIGIPLLVTTSPIFDDEGELTGSVHIAKDITERKKAEGRIKASLEEKEVLLREIHHRVKNNMQVISSLLRLQSRKIEDDKSINIFRECQNRVESMALIHMQLYQSESLANIDFAEYVKELMQNLITSYDIDPGKIALTIDVEKISLGIELAIPCALLINEMISNCLKHAFGEGASGQIKISMQLSEIDQIELTISDNGVGIPEDLDFRKTESLGMQLIISLAENQLQGEIELNKDEGTEFRIRFKMADRVAIDNVKTVDSVPA